MIRSYGRTEGGEVSEEPTCGEGLAANAALPAKLAEVIASVASVLELHTKALDLGDENAREEYDAYVKLVERHRRTAAELRALGEQMVSYRDLPMARHNVEAMSTPEAADAFEQLVNVEHELWSLLHERAEQHRPLLRELRSGSKS
jgi:hypothetical protein